MMMLLK